jgi:uncharacterized protein (DUF427 family)
MMGDIVARWQGEEIARSSDTVVVEGNHYFPRAHVREDRLEDSDHESVCPWKGTAHYHSVRVGDSVNRDAAWFYPEPKDGAGEIRDRIAFWRGIEVREES